MATPAKKSLKKSNKIFMVVRNTGSSLVDYLACGDGAFYASLEDLRENIIDDLSLSAAETFYVIEIDPATAKEYTLNSTVQPTGKVGFPQP